jgi:hypothetical protein
MTQKILSRPLSLHRQPSLFTQGNDHDVESSRGCSSLTTRPIRLLNPPLSSPHHRPSPWRLPPTDLACFCLPLTVEVSSASRHPPAAPCTFSTGCLSSCFSLTNRRRNSAAPLPSIRWVDSLACTAEVQRLQRDPSATLCTSCWDCKRPRVAPSTDTSTQQSTVRLFVSNCCLYVVFVCHFDLITLVSSMYLVCVDGWFAARR